MKTNISYSSNLINYPSFLKGAARVWDLYGNIDVYNYSKTDDEADYTALKLDWEMIGYDIKQALKKYESIIRQ